MSYILQMLDISFALFIAGFIFGLGLASAYSLFKLFSIKLSINLYPEDKGWSVNGEGIKATTSTKKLKNNKK